MNFLVQFSKEEIRFAFPMESTLGAVKLELYQRTLVPVERQKIMGVTFKGKPPSDDLLLQDLQMKKKGGSFFLILFGTPEERLMKEPDPSEQEEIIDDMDWDFWPTEDIVQDIKDRKEKLEKVIAETVINIIHPLDDNKKLIVLDLDRTLFDFKKTGNVFDTMRPGLVPFLCECWKHYNIAIWSATSWNWLEIKLTELNLLTNPNFRISFVLDKTSMFSVKSMSQKGVVQHTVKPLGVIWSKFPQFSPKNTIHVDDLSRNFVMNPKNGIKVLPFRLSATSHTDDELLVLVKYVVEIATLEDLSLKDHSNW